jgi:glucokinase
MILIADIGGTNSRLALVKEKSNRFFKLKVYKSKEFKNFYQLVRFYFSDIKLKESPSVAILAVAGPVFKDKAHLTNLNWNISACYLKKSFGFKKVILVNDLYSLAASSLLMSKKYILRIKKGESNKKVPKAFIAPGTGLGEAILVRENPLTILPTEGGHIFFSSLNEEEFGYFKFLKQKGEELSWEKALSGISLSYWYEYYWNEKLKPEKITELAKDNDSKATRVIKKFLELLGRKVSQLALFSLPQGGIYMGGGVVQALKDFFNEKEFEEAFWKGYFENKKMKSLLEKFEINILDHPYPVLLGALAILHNQLD